jgi:glutamate decarboxylase
MSKNLADNDEYPAMLHLHQRCVSIFLLLCFSLGILGNLWRAPKGPQAIGTATTGSSEAILLGGLAMKRRWFEKRKAEGNSN